MTDVSGAPANNGTMRVADARTKFIAVRCTEDEHAAINAAAARAGLSVGAYLRTLALGKAGPRSVHRPTIDQVEIARLKGWVGRLNGNVNQIAKAIHTTQNWPLWTEIAALREEVVKMSAALMKALGHDHQG